MVIKLINTCFAVVKKNRNNVKRAYPISFMWSRISGAFFSLAVPFLLYFVVFDRSMSSTFEFHTNTNDYLTYVVIGEVLNVLSFATLMNVGRCLITEIREGTLDTFLLSPASRIGYFLGAYIEQFFRSIIEVFFVLFFGVILGARLPIQMLILIIISIILCSIAFFAVSILVSTVMVYTRDTYLVQNTFFLVMNCLCGVVFPIEYLPFGVQILSKVFPLTPALNLLRGIVFGNVETNSLCFECMHMILLSLVYFVVGYLGFKRYESKLIEDVLA